ncbi:DNA polymerase III subunit gamma/tau [Helicobacter mesocricetorum]|uniref:DNA polymerase III subunit gamma/tau n=1 Tax=Helicobacter mesocricetorum TaxID=87012 RepID=UPI000CF078FB|nr:DNA polymerase III subunit gamma/tau [Helicobacter mesocricetorum]
MEEHNEALALKYRPMDFDELVGQESISKTLSLALNTKRLSHAYLFSGLRGSGKTSSARIFARALECENGPKAKPCGICANCIAANPHKMRHIDIIELDGASNRKIDDIRDLIEQTKYHPNMGRFKIFIIDEVHMLTKEAFNALLKTLEEPPPYVKFILATTDPLKLPATILSRTQHFRFKRISDKSILEHLKNILQKEGITYEEEALKMLIRSGSGSLRDTLTLLDQVIIYSNYNITTNTCASMLGLINPQSLQSLFECILNNDREKLLKAMEGFLEYESEMLLDEMSIFLKNKLLKGDNAYNVVLIDRFFRIIAQAKELLFLGSDDNFVLTLTLLKMLEALQIQEIDTAIENLKNQSPQLPIPKAPTPSPSPIQTPTLAKESPSLFQLLLQKIYERNYDLGECFEKNITFVSFDNNLLIWESKAKDADKERLKNSYSIIKNLVLEIFGLQTQIKSLSKEESSKTPETPNTIPNTTSHNITPDSAHTNTQQKLEDSPSNDPKMEVTQALETPLLKSAKELLGIKQIKVRPKEENLCSS